MLCDYISCALGVPWSNGSDMILATLGRFTDTNIRSGSIDFGLTMIAGERV